MVPRPLVGAGAAGATVLGLLSWLQMRTEIPPNLRTDYRIAAVLSWLLWVPVLAVLGRPCGG